MILLVQLSRWGNRLRDINLLSKHPINIQDFFPDSKVIFLTSVHRASLSSREILTASVPGHTLQWLRAGVLKEVGSWEHFKKTMAGGGCSVRLCLLPLFTLATCQSHARCQARAVKTQNVFLLLWGYVLWSSVAISPSVWPMERMSVPCCDVTCISLDMPLWETSSLIAEHRKD